MKIYDKILNIFGQKACTLSISQLLTNLIWLKISQKL